MSRVPVVRAKIPCGHKCQLTIVTQNLHSYSPNRGVQYYILLGTKRERWAERGRKAERLRGREGEGLAITRQLLRLGREKY